MTLWNHMLLSMLLKLQQPVAIIIEVIVCKAMTFLSEYMHKACTYARVQRKAQCLPIAKIFILKLFKRDLPCDLKEHIALHES